MKRACTQAFTKVNENIVCEFSRQVGTSYVSLVKNNHMKLRKSVIYIILLFVAGIAGCNGKPPSLHISTSPETAAVREFRSVYKVIDGDTFWMKNQGGQTEKIRFIGIDAPECRKSAHKDIQRFGKESKDFLVGFLKGKKVALEYDVERYDRYGRTLAYVYLEDGTFLNEYLIKNGYAKVVTFPPNVKYHRQFVIAERYARQHQLGMWRNN